VKEMNDAPKASKVSGELHKSIPQVEKHLQKALERIKVYRLRKKHSSYIEVKENIPTEDFFAEKLVEHFFIALSPSRARFHSRGHNLEHIKKAMFTIVDSLEEKILTEPEANMAIEFLASKFVQNRFDDIFFKILDVDKPRTCTFHKITGRVK